MQRAKGRRRARAQSLLLNANDKMVFVSEGAGESSKVEDCSTLVLRGGDIDEDDLPLTAQTGMGSVVAVMEIQMLHDDVVQIK